MRALRRKREDPLRPGTATKVAAEPSGPRPALVRISLPKQRPRRRGRLLETIRAPPSDVYPYPKIFLSAMRLPGRTLLGTPSAARLVTAPTKFHADLPCLSAQAAFIVPIYPGKKRGVRCDPRFSTEAEIRAERTRGLPGCAYQCRSRDLGGASALGRHYALQPVASTPL